MNARPLPGHLQHLVGKARFDAGKRYFDTHSDDGGDPPSGSIAIVEPGVEILASMSRSEFERLPAREQAARARAGVKLIDLVPVHDARRAAPANPPVAPRPQK